MSSREGGVLRLTLVRHPGAHIGALEDGMFFLTKFSFYSAPGKPALGKPSPLLCFSQTCTSEEGLPISGVGTSGCPPHGWPVGTHPRVSGGQAWSLFSPSFFFFFLRSSCGTSLGKATTMTFPSLGALILAPRRAGPDRKQHRWDLCQNLPCKFSCRVGCMSSLALFNPGLPLPTL